MEKTELSDHDLLIKIHTVLTRAVEDIKDLRDNTAGRLDGLEKKVELLERKVFADSSFKKFAIWFGALILGLIIYHLTGYHL